MVFMNLSTHKCKLFPTSLQSNEMNSAPTYKIKTIRKLKTNFKQKNKKKTVQINPITKTSDTNSFHAIFLFVLNLKNDFIFFTEENKSYKINFLSFP